MNKRGVSKKNKSGKFREVYPRVSEYLEPDAVTKKFINSRIQKFSGIVPFDDRGTRTMKYNTPIMLGSFEIEHNGYKYSCMVENFSNRSSYQYKQLFISTYHDETNSNSTHVSCACDLVTNERTYNVDYEDVGRTSFFAMSDEEKFQYSTTQDGIEELIELEKVVELFNNVEFINEEITLLRILKNL